MRLRLYRARTIPEAMARLRAELGSEALILATRRVGDGVELTAALEPAEEAAPHRAQESPLAWHGVPAGLARRLDGAELAASLARELSFGTLPTGGEAPLLLAGPPGAGKTLTVAKLATRLVLAGQAPLVITTDGRRAGAAEELAAYTRLLGISLVVASRPNTLTQALARRHAGAPVLIDTAGANPFQAADREAVAGLAALARATTALVLPAGLDPAEAADLAAGFAAAGASLLVPTRLDLARRLGGILAAAAAAALVLTEGGTGPGAADGLTPLTADYLAARLGRTDIAPPTRIQDEP